MNKRERYKFTISYFLAHAPNAETELNYEGAYQLLVAVILSAQCTDKRINLTTPPIFERYPDVYALSKADDEELFQLVKSVSYPNNKTKHLIGMAKMIIEQFKGQIPMTVDELTQLPGVGRKTANVITSVIDAQPNIAVDTHVFRVSARIGLTSGAKNPLQTEKQLLKYTPEKYVAVMHHWLILHGRYICVARRPKCEICGLKPMCRYYHKVVLKGNLVERINEPQKQI
jgi:endonuclease-3